MAAHRFLRDWHSDGADSFSELNVKVNVFILKFLTLLAFDCNLEASLLT